MEYELEFTLINCDGTEIRKKYKAVEEFKEEMQSDSMDIPMRDDRMKDMILWKILFDVDWDIDVLLNYLRGEQMKEKHLKDCQKDYAVAAAAVKAIEEEITMAEREYIRNHRIVNAEGIFPDHIYCIDDETVFEKANLEFSQIIVGKGLESALNEAKSNLLKAEESLLTYGISIAPEAVRETLRRGVNSNYSIRCRLIDMVFRLDTETMDRKR